MVGCEFEVKVDQCTINTDFVYVSFIVDWKVIIKYFVTVFINRKKIFIQSLCMFVSFR